jgi:starch phosphorylase
MTMKPNKKKPKPGNTKRAEKLIQPSDSVGPMHNLLPAQVREFELLAEVALDLRWTWNHGTDEFWRRLDPALWELTRNPWLVLQTVSRSRLEQALVDPVLRQQGIELLRAKREAERSPSWFAQTHPKSPLTCVAYFSMEFMLSEALPIYSGGLGNVAGDQLKAASDLGVPVVGVGLLYQQGYFRQVLNRDGAQEALFPYNDPAQLPITPVRDANSKWLRVEIRLPGFSIWLRVWQAQVGRVKLYLLDSNDPANPPAFRGVTSELYGGGPEMRLRQELLLGVGGWRLLKALGLQPEVCHLNEGHAAFVVLERAFDLMKQTGQSFEVALTASRPGNLFTTHTAVAAGFDCFEPGLIEKYLRLPAEHHKVPLRQLLALGRLDPENDSENFNMAYLAIRGSGAVNGVSRLHGEVSRRLFAPLFPRWPEAEVPVGHVTNGVHMPSWNSAAADKIWTDACQKGCWLGFSKTLEQDIRRVPDERLWQMRGANRRALIEYARQRLARELACGGASPEEVETAKHLFDPDVLTIGFARRFATYKRPNLLLHDQQRLLRILSDTHRPVQLIIAGKAHPADQVGQAMIREWIQFIRRPEVRPHAMFLGDYDMQLAEELVQGVDVWLNMPRRPWEASGTSGMKVLVNGGLNLAELDGWWAEAYKPEVGWAFGDGFEHDSSWDATEAEQLYRLIETQVVPEFYQVNEMGIPQAWVARIRESMAQLTMQFSADRTVREYTEKYYLPAAAAWLERVSNGAVKAAQITQWRNLIRQHWSALRFGEMKVKTDNNEHLFEVQVYLDELQPHDVQVELYADSVNGNETVRQPMKPILPLMSASGYLYRANVAATRPASDFTARLLPHHPSVAAPMEANLILWQR